MPWDRRVRRYQRFLKSLKRPESTLCSCPVHIHPRSWVPPPCLTSKSQEEESLYRHRSLSNPELRMRSSTSQLAKDVDNQHQQQSLQHLYNEARILKEAFNKVRQGDHIAKDSRNVIKKWSKKSPRHRTQSEPESHGQRVDPSQEIAELDKSFAEAVEEEEALKQELKNVREIMQNRAAFEEENKKLKKKIRQLQHRIKRQDEAQRISRESLQAEREMGSREEYILISLKKKYDDLLQYVLKVESENQKLKSLHGMSGDGDEFLHDFDRENSEYERRDVTRLQGDLEALRSEVMKKDSRILECEERLQAMEALKEENLALHKSLRSAHESDSRPDPRDISTALEEEWMRRLAETREMYERAIEGYRDQLQEMQERFQHMEVTHDSHVKELMQNIDELKRKKQLADGNSDRTSDPGVNRVGPGVSRVDPSVNRVDPGVSGEGVHDYERSEETQGYGVNGVRARDDEIFERADVTDADDERDKASASEEGRGKSLNTEESGDLLENQKSKRKDDRKGVKKIELKVSHKETQTLPLKFLDREETRVGSGDSHHEPEVLGVQEEMRESKEYLERVNRLVKRLESMKLNGEGAEAILSVIRDTINDCLLDWRESFQQQQKALQKDSADENRGYVELQRKLRAKSKQLESRQKQCRQLEEKNAKLAQQCNQLETRITAAQASDRLGLLEDLPETLRNTEEKLSEFQEAFQRAQGEKNALQEQIRNLNEKLNKKETKLAAGLEKVLNKDTEIRNLQEAMAVLRHQLEEGSREVTLLKEQLSTKDTILEHTSTQLDERIRECASLSSQIERLKMQNSQEARSIQVQIDEHESSTQKQLMEAKALAARYQAQLSALRSEKDHSEKSLRHNVRKLEEQIDQLQLRNSVLQRQLTTITSTYHSMFTSVDINPVSPPGISDPNAK